MSKLRKILPDLLTDLAYGLLFCGITVVPAFAYSFQSAGGALWGLLLLPAVLLYNFLRRVCGVFVLFSFSHVLCLLGIPYGIYCFTGNLIQTLGVLAFLLILTIYSFTRRLGRESAGLTLPQLLAFAGFFLAAAVILDKALGLQLYTLYTVFTGVSFLLFVCFTQVINIEETFRDAFVQSAQYTKSVFRFNNRSTALFLLLSALLMGIVFLLPVSDALWALLYALRDGIRALLGLLPESESEAPVLPAEEAQQGGMDLSELLPKDEPKEPLIPPEVLQAIVLTFLILLILFGIVYFIYRMYRRFGEEADATGDIKEFVKPRELQLTERAKKGLRQLFERIVGPENKIRRLFYRQVREYHKKKKQTIQPSETAADIAKRMEAENGEIAELRQRYDAVRYGDEDTPK